MSIIVPPLPCPASVLPHGKAFRFVDSVVALDERSIVATRWVPLVEPWTTAHFPEAAIVPGVLLIEGMAQTCGILARAVDGFQPVLGAGMLTGVRHARFHAPVSPGCLLLYHAERFSRVGSLFCFRSRISVDDKLIAHAELVLQIGASTPSTWGGST